MGSRQILQTLGHKLGASSPATLSKAEELHRLLSAKGVRSISNTAEAIICLQLAASITGDTCDKSMTAKLSGLSVSKYRSQLQVLGQLLGLQPRVTIHDLAITHSALSAEALAKDVLSSYTKGVYGGMDDQLPLYQVAALAAAAKELKVKLDRRRMLEASGAQKKVFDTLLEKLTAIAKQLNDKKQLPTAAADGKRKKTNTLMDIIEDNLAAAANADQEQVLKERISNSKHAKTDTKAQEDEEYEDWKRKILQGAHKE